MELREKSLEELRGMADDLKKDIVQTTLTARGRGEHAHCKTRKKDLARIMTIMREHEMKNV